MLRRHPVLGALTGGYLVLVGVLTLVKGHLITSSEQVVRRAFDSRHAAWMPRRLDSNEIELLANVVLFVPIGMFLTLLVGARRWMWAVVASCALTAGIEACQAVLASGVPDVRDLVANSLGGAVGVWLALILTRASERRAALLPAPPESGELDPPPKLSGGAPPLQERPSPPPTAGGS